MGRGRWVIERKRTSNAYLIFRVVLYIVLLVIVILFQQQIGNVFAGCFNSLAPPGQ
jgi:hypothetical protein